MLYRSQQKGFTVIEVIVAGLILIVLSVGIMTAFSTVTNLNRINNVRSQALTVLQREVEAFRSFRFVPGTTDSRLFAGTYPNYKTGVTSADGIPFNISVVVDNDPNNSVGGNLDSITDTNCKFKQITITAVLQNPQGGVLSNLQTQVVIQRVRAN
ncbi:MAG: type II secretion system protein [bacterium]|nr:type II secretion system protein [bacterium]